MEAWQRPRARGANLFLLPESVDAAGSKCQQVEALHPQDPPSSSFVSPAIRLLLFLTCCCRKTGGTKETSRCSHLSSPVAARASDPSPAGDKRLPAAKDSAESGKGGGCDGHIHLVNESKLKQHLLFGWSLHSRSEEGVVMTLWTLTFSIDEI